MSRLNNAYGKRGIYHCVQRTIRMVEVLETAFGAPDPRLVSGEGDGEDVEKFKRDHIKARNRMAAEGQPLTDETVLILELFESDEV